MAEKTETLPAKSLPIVGPVTRDMVLAVLCAYLGVSRDHISSLDVHFEAGLKDTWAASGYDKRDSDG